MNKGKELNRLAQISQLILDVKLAALRSAVNKRQQSLDLLARLNTPAAETDLQPMAVYQAELRFQHWAEARRAEINLALARQTAQMNLARDDASQAFSRDQALRGLRAKLR